MLGIHSEPYCKILKHYELRNFVQNHFEEDKNAQNFVLNYFAVVKNTWKRKKTFGNWFQTIQGQRKTLG
jgi:hypothetical protein